MASATTDPATGAPQPPAEASDYLQAPSGAASWLLTRDHKRVGIMYLAGVIAVFIAGSVLAMILRAELLTPQMDMLSSRGIGVEPEAAAAMGRELYNKLFTMHGTLMIFVFAIPAIPAALGNFLLPLMVGARNVAFPRLNLASFYLWLVGTLVVGYAALSGQLDTGWTFYTPYSTQGADSVIIASLGLAILGLSSILTGVNFIVTTHKLRAPGVTWNRLPLFVWSLYAAAIIQLIATPVFIVTMLVLIAENLWSIGIFEPSMGGDPVLYQHLFWFYMHAAFSLMILPAFGLVSEILSVHSKKHIFGYKSLALAMIAMALLALLGSGQHLVVAGQSSFASVVSSLFALAIAVPVMMHLFSWVATLKGGAITFTAPLVYALMVVSTVAIGALSGLSLGALSVDVHLHDSAFVVGHAHYMTVGGVVLALVAAIHHWFPKMFGKRYDERQAVMAAITIFIGLNLAFFPQLIAGAQGLARDHAEYDAAFQGYQLVSSLGAFLLMGGIFWALIVLVRGLMSGEQAPANPWGAGSLEWAASSPPIGDNFAQTPRVDRGPYEYPEIDPTMQVGHH